MCPTVGESADDAVAEGRKVQHRVQYVLEAIAAQPRPCGESCTVRDSWTGSKTEDLPVRHCDARHRLGIVLPEQWRGASVQHETIRSPALTRTATSSFVA